MDKFMNKIHDKVQKHLGDKGGSSGGAGAGGAPPFTHQSNEGGKPVIPQPGQRPAGPGQMPPKIANVNYTDSHKFYHPSGKQHNTLRDLGYTSVLDGKLIWSWGDTLMGTPEQNMICAVDSTSIGSMVEPMASMDTALAPGSDNVRNWIPLNHQEESSGGYGVYSFGGTNIVEVGPNKGIVYYLKMSRPGGQYDCKGAGVATAEIDRHGVPNAKRHHDTLWNPMEPSWGDVGVVLNAKDDHIYAFGHGSTKNDEFSSRTYLCKVHKDKALELHAYEYWDNAERRWRKERIGDGQNGTIACTNEMAIFDWHAMNQSTPFWSNYYNKWMFLHGCGFPNSPIICKTADNLEGPWEDHGDMAKTDPNGNEEGFRYCYTAHPEFDETGKKVLVTWTRNNIIYGVWLEFQ